VEQPVLVVAGASDRIVGMAAKRNLSRGLPNGQLEIFPRSGHGTPIDSWDRFNERMIQWLQEVSGL
jgi:pimeloyl-ACP methyl ester carboxylesterase